MTGGRMSAIPRSQQENEFAVASGGGWLDARRADGSKYKQVMCEGCCFQIDMVPEDKPTFEQLQRRFQHRCPVVLFSQMAGSGAGILARRDAYAFLQQQSWGPDEIQELLDSLALPGGAGEVNREEFVRAFDAVMCEITSPRKGTKAPIDGKGKFSGGKTIHDAIAISLEQPLYLMQFCGTVVQPKGTASVEHWHEQAVCHLGLKGSLRVSPSGLLVDVGMSLQGAYADLRAFADAFLSSTSANQSEGVAIPMRLMAQQEPRLLEIKVTKHGGKADLLRAHRADVEALAERGVPLAPPYSLQSPTSLRSSPERAGPTPGRHAHPSPAPPAATPWINGSNATPATRHSPEHSHARPPPDSPMPATPVMPRVPSAESTGGREGGEAAGAQGESTAAALYDYEAQEEDELSIFAGQVVQVMAEHDDGWSLVQNSQGAFGVVPGNYLRGVPPAVAPARTPTAQAALSLSSQAKRSGAETLATALGLGQAAADGAGTPGASAGRGAGGEAHEASGWGGGGVWEALDAAEQAADAMTAQVARLAGQLLPSKGSADPVRAAAAGLHVHACRAAATSAREALAAARETLASSSSSVSKAPSAAQAQVAAGSSPPGGAHAKDRLADILSDSSSDSDDSDVSRPRGATGGGSQPRASAASVNSGAGWPRGSVGGGRGGEVSRERSGDLSDESDGEGLEGSGRAMVPHPLDGAIPKLNLSDMASPPGGAPHEKKQWRVYVQLIEARDLPQRAGDMLPSAFTCASLFRLSGALLDPSAAFPVEHSTAAGEDGQGVFIRKVVPQQRSKIFHRGTSPTWNQAFVFADVYPDPAHLSPDLRPDEVGRAPLDGQQVALLLSVHDSAASAGGARAGGGRSAGDDDLIGTAVIPVRQGHPSDHWVVLRTRRVNPKRKNPAVHLRVAYGSSAPGTKGDTARMRDTAFLA